jgi:hypothetical protein
MQGDAAAGVAHIHQGVVLHGMGDKPYRPYYLALLAEAYGQAGQPAEARQVLAPVYGWFTEGFTTSDLREAEALLKVLDRVHMPSLLVVAP